MGDTSPRNESSRKRRSKAEFDFEEDDTLVKEVGEHHGFVLDEDADPAERRRDPLRTPH